jgi:NitT/TauT family transport system ATP-binding protein
MISLQNVHFRYPGDVKDTLAEISFDIQNGSFISLLGPSGCGKSTLLRLIAGLLKPTQGTIQNPSINVSTPATSFVFQEPRLLPWRTVLENVQLPFEFDDKSSERDQTIEQTLLSVGLQQQDFYKKPAMLSGGMKMRVSLARALVTQPALLLMDEPFAALDELLRHELNTHLLQLWQQYQWTGIFVTHNISEAVFLSQKIYVFSTHPGRIVSIIDLPQPVTERIGTDTQQATTVSDQWRQHPQFLQTVMQLTQTLREYRESA